jgi:hypothetical protein
LLRALLRGLIFKNKQPIGVGAGVLGTLVGGGFRADIRWGIRRYFGAHTTQQACLPEGVSAQSCSCPSGVKLGGWGWGQRRLSYL